MFESIETATAALLGLLLGAAGASAADLTLFEAGRPDAPRWESIDDGVMGGRSRGRAALTAEGTLAFRGVLSLENQGGFSSIRARLAPSGLAGRDGLALRLKGDGRSYRVTLHSRGLPPALFHWAELRTEPGAWLEVRLPFARFEPTLHGRRLPGPRLQAAQVEGVGLMLYDKQAGPFALEVARIAAYEEGPPEPAPAATPQAAPTIRELAARAGTFRTLLAAAEAAGLLEALDGPLTVLAPTDAAFEALPAGVLRDLLAPGSRERLRLVLAHHLLPGRVTLAEALGGGQATAQSGQRLVFALEGGAARVGGAGVLSADLACRNGVVHALDRVLLPELGSLVDVAARAGTFGTLLAAARAGGLDGALAGEGPFTLFAPSDAAFAALPEGTLARLLEPGQRPALLRLLKHHVVPGRLPAVAALAAGRAATLAGTELRLGYAEGALRVEGATLRAADLPARNGLVHVVERVLLPPAQVGAAEREAARGAARRLIARAIERGAPLFNAGREDECRAVYEQAAATLLERPDLLGGPAAARLRAALVRPDGPDATAAHAWALRRALDAAHADLAPGPRPAESF